MHYQAIYARLKTFLADRSGIDRSRLKAATMLRRHPLNYDEQGMRSLAGQLNRVFSDPPMNRSLTPAMTARAETIRDLYQLIRSAYA